MQEFAAKVRNLGPVWGVTIPKALIDQGYIVVGNSYIFKFEINNKEEKTEVVQNGTGEEKQHINSLPDNQ